MRKKIDTTRIIQAVLRRGRSERLLDLTLTDVAEELGIKTPSLYNHIAGIEELYQLLALEALKQLKEELVNVLVGHSGREAVEILAVTYLDFSEKQPTLYEAIENPRLIDVKEVAEGKAAIVALIKRVFSSFEQSEEKHDEVVIHEIRALRSYLHGFASLNRQGLFRMEIDPQKSFLVGLHALLDGFDRRA